MKASLSLKNIGQEEDEQNFSFNSGNLTLITGRNASGKSRIIKSIALALSYPIKSQEIKQEAIRLGILKSEEADYNPLVNSSKKLGKVSLEYDDISRELELEREGDIMINIPGNEKFLYSSLIVRTSRIYNNISSGNPDFNWIVNEMSLAKDYETILEILESYLGSFEEKKEELLKNEEKIKDIENELNKLQEKKTTLENQIEEIEKQISDIEENPELKEKRNDLKKEINTIKKNLSEYNTKIDNLEKENKEIKRKINNNSKNIEDKKEEIDLLNRREEELKNINKQEITNEIVKLEREKGPHREDLGAVEENINNYKEQSQKLGDKDQMLCPLCHKGTILRKEVESKLNKYLEERKNIKNDIEEINDEIREKESLIKEASKLPKIQKEIRELRESLAIIEGELSRGNEDIADNNKTIKSLRNQIEPEEEALQNKEKKLEQTEQEIKKEDQYKPLFKKENELNRKLGNIEREISNLLKKKSDLETIEILEYQLKLPKAKNLIKKLENILKEVKTYLISKIKQQREGAAKKFNENIKNLTEKIGFTDFKKIYLDLEDYHLNLIRKNDTYQELNSLSEGEKDIITSLLQICTKETYLPNVPFLLGDDIVSDIDPVRQDIFLNYLKESAEKNNWFIILTKLSDEEFKITEI